MVAFSHRESSAKVLHTVVSLAGNTDHFHCGRLLS